MPFMAISGFIEYFARQYETARRRLSGVLESARDPVLPRQFLARVLLALGQGQAVLRLLDGRNVTAPGSFSILGRAYPPEQPVEKIKGRRQGLSRRVARRRPRRPDEAVPDVRNQQQFDRHAGRKKAVRE